MKRHILILAALLALGCAHAKPAPEPVAPAEEGEKHEATQAEKERGGKAAWFLLEAVETIIFIAK